MALAEAVYRETARFPESERYGLVSQMRRAAVSIPSNLAEGAGRSSRGELVQFVGISCGSIAELETQIELAVRLGYLPADAAVVEQTYRVGMLIRKLRTSLQSRR